MTRRSAICGSRRGRSRSRTARAKLLPVLVITAAHSRFMTGRMIPTRKTEDLLLGSWELIQQLGRVPRRLIWDNEPGIGRGKRRAEGVAAFMGTLATKLVLLPPQRPGVQGDRGAPQRLVRDLVHARPDVHLTGGLQRPVHRLADHARTRGWCARSRPAPVDLLDADRAAMLPLPPIPLHLGWRNRIRLGRDYYVRLDTNDYSVDPHAIGRMVDVTADLDRVRVRLDGRIVADHARVWARGTTVTDPAHVETAAPAAQAVPAAPRRRCRR